jgi:DNA-binding NtrC family response regulator
MGRLARSSVLIVEDEVLVALDLETVLARVGCPSVRVSGNIDDALAEIERAPPDVALVDLNVAGRLSLAVVDALAGAAIPFLIVSGHTPEILPPRHRHHPFMLKPYDSGGLLRRLEQLLATHLARPGGPS